VTTRTARLFSIASVAALAVLGAGVTTASPAFGIASTRFVRPNGVDAANNCKVQGSPCATIGHALAQAAAGDTVQLEPGTYLVSHNPAGTSNTVPSNKAGITIQSDPGTGTAANTIIDATGVHNGLVVNANGVTVNKISVVNADLQGILVSPPTDAVAPASVGNVTLTGSVITNNDACEKHLTSADCPPPDPNDDFGEAVQLLSVINSTVSLNQITHNVGGILMTDELGPNHGNTITHNNVSANTLDCGITLAGHNTTAVATSGANIGHAQPTSAGVYNNTISDNTANDNGAAGVIIAGGPPGAAAYGNHVTGNTANDNGLAGISIHSHTPLQDMNDNVIMNNFVSHDALSGGTAGAPGDSDAGVTKTTGLLVLAAAAPVSGTVITGNHISNVAIGVWLSAATPTTTVTANTISVVAGGTPIVVKKTGAPIVGMTTTNGGNGYEVASSDGAQHPFGGASYFGSVAGTPLNRPVVGTASTGTSNGYWMVASDGGIFSFGDAHFLGSMGGTRLNMPIVGMAATPSGNGYWLVASDGGIFSFGGAHFHGSMGAVRLNQPIVGMASTPSGNGYWLVASDGGIFAFGDAHFFGSMGAVRLNKPVVGMEATTTGAGYRMDAADGGIFSFGNAPFLGSMGAVRLNMPVVGMAATPSGDGYWMVASDGGMFSFGDAHFHGSVVSQ
jgi:hypothetical protein